VFVVSEVLPYTQPVKLTLTPGKELLEAVSTDIERDPMRRNEVPEIRPSRNLWGPSGIPRMALPTDFRPAPPKSDLSEWRVIRPKEIGSYFPESDHWDGTSSQRDKEM
jgi:hypothetical protein